MFGKLLSASGAQGCVKAILLGKTMSASAQLLLPPSRHAHPAAAPARRGFYVRLHGQALPFD